jgi:hypothetical protein
VVSVGTPGRFFFDLSSSWKVIIENLLNHPNFGQKLKAINFLDAKAKEIREKGGSTETKIWEAFRFIKESIRWDGTKSILADESIKKSFEEDHSGNSAEINLALIYLIKEIGIEVYPMVLSTRDNGMLVEFSPTISKLNYVIGYVDHEGFTMFLDATGENAVPGILPDYCLNGRGLLVKKDNEQWFTLNTKFRAVKNQFITLTMIDQNKVVAQVNQELIGYSFMSWMKDLKEANDEKERRIDQLKKSNEAVNVVDYKILSKDPDKLVGKELIEVDLTDQSTVGTGEIFINPFVFFDFEKNMLTDETRRYPLDLTYPREIKTTLIAEIPPTHDVASYPMPTRFSTPDGGANFTFFSEPSQGKLNIRLILKINKYVFAETEYLEMRQFFSEVIKTVSTPIQLVKK